MLTFLNSAILVGLVAIALPILIHLFTRQKIKTVYFSSLKFLKELQKQKIRRLKIRQILLLLLRTLLILLLVLAFARPALKKTRSSALESGAQITAVIILDNTLSMGREVKGRRLLDEAKERALEILKLLRPGDEMYLLLPQDPPVFAHEGPRYSVETMEELIRNTSLSYRKTDYFTALIMASEIMQQSKNINREIYLIGDLQKSALRKALNNHVGKIVSENVNVFVVPLDGTKAENLSIESVNLANQILEKGKVVEVEAVVRNNSDAHLKNKLVHLFVNGKRVGQNVVDVDPHSSQKVLFRMVPERTGLQQGYVFLEEDDLLEDNRRYFSFRIPEEIPVLLVGKDETDLRYLELALRPGREHASYIKLDKVSYKRLASQNFGTYRAIIFSNVPQLDNTTVLKLRGFLADGGGLMIFLGEDVDLRNYNEVLHKKLHLPLLSELSRHLEKNQFLSFGKVDFSHPIFHGVFESERKQFVSPHIRFMVRVKAEKPLDKVIEYSNGEPFLFESNFQRGRIMYFTTGVSAEWSDLAFKGIFVPLIYRCVIYLAGGTSDENREFLIGDEISFQPAEKISAGDFTIEKPDGSQTKIKPEISQGSYLLRITDTDEPGIYKLHASDRVLAQWAVNYDAAELENEAFDVEKLETLMEGAQVFTSEKMPEIVTAVTESRFGEELWKYLIAVALVLLLLEMFIMRETQEVQ